MEGTVCAGFNGRLLTVDSFLPWYCASSFTACSACGAVLEISLMTNCDSAARASDPLLRIQQGNIRGGGEACKRGGGATVGGVQRVDAAAATSAYLKAA